jgi:hypothetical protein
MTFLKTPEKIKTVAMILMTVEVLLYAMTERPLDAFSLPLLLVILSLAGGGLTVYLAFYKSYGSEKTAPPANTPNAQFFSLAGFAPYWIHLLGILCIGWIVKGIIKEYPPVLGYSDIIPQVQVLLKRFWAGELPYQPITEWGWEMFPTYMPFQWLPFSIPEFLGFDYRYFALAVWAIITMWIFRSNLFQQSGQASKWLFLILPFAYLYGQSHMFNATYEIMIGGYYLFVLYSFRNTSLWVRGIALSVCLLSRYSLVLFVPFYFVYMLLEEGTNKTLRLGLIMLGMGIVFYVLPFMSRDPLIFFKSYGYHSFAALGEWQHHQGMEMPIHLSNKLGMAGYFYKFGSGEVVDRLRLLQQTHLLLCLLITIGLAGLYYYHKQKERIQTPILFLIGGFKIYIGIFYSFIQIPYQYLFTVPVFSTIIAILYLGNFCFTPTNTTPRN